jgi:shikimate dehydrogenase
MENFEVHPLDALEDAVSEAEVVVNATSLGMREGDPLPIPVQYLNKSRAVCDAVYLPGRETPLIRQARERGAPAVSGKRMLLYQGVQAQRLWTGREPNVKAMDDAIA